MAQNKRTFLSQARETDGMAFGDKSVARGYYSVAMGVGLQSDDFASLTVGQYNALHSGRDRYFDIGNTAFAIGNGNEVQRSNALEVDFKGNMQTAGDIKCGYGQNVISVTELDSKVSTLDSNAVALANTTRVSLDDLDVRVSTIMHFYSGKDQTKDSLEDLFTSVATIGSSLGALTTNVATIDSSLGVLTTNVANIDSSIGDLFAAVATINSSLGALTTDVATVDTLIGALATNVATIDSSTKDSLEELVTTISVLTAKISTLENKVSNLQSDTTTIETSVVSDIRRSISTVSNNSLIFGIVSIIVLAIGGIGALKWMTKSKDDTASNSGYNSFEDSLEQLNNKIAF